jgi:hypothetical protein
MLLQSDEVRSEQLIERAKQGVKERYEHYQELAAERHHDGNGKAS